MAWLLGVRTARAMEADASRVASTTGWVGFSDLDLRVEVDLVVRDEEDPCAPP
jgi:hypothetical protein